MTFSDTLLSAIGTERTKAEFAKEAGITPELVSRMLNKKDYKPSLSTLRKIAGHSVNGVTLEELIEACDGYKKAEKSSTNKLLSERRAKMSPKEQVEACIKDIEAGLQSFIGITGKDVYELMDTVSRLFSIEDISYYIGEEFEISENDVGRLFPEEKGRVVEVSWIGDGYTARTAFLLRYISGSEKIHILSYSMDRDIFDDCKYYTYLPYEMWFEVKDNVKTRCDNEMMYCIRYPEILADLPEIESSAAETKYKRKCSDLKLQKFAAEHPGLSKEAILLEYMFSVSFEPRIPVSGTGFSLRKLPKQKFVAFLEKHQKTFIRSEAEKDIYNKCMELRSNEDKTSLLDINYFFADYTDDATGKTTDFWVTAITNIMYRETGFRFSLCFDGEDGGSFDGPVVLFKNRPIYDYTEAEKELSEKTLFLIMDKYALELQSDVFACHAFCYGGEERD